MGDRQGEGWLLAGLALLFLGAAAGVRVNHDESQYVAAIAMMREGLPFRDWPYLQTPLQPLLLSPLGLLPAGWLFPAARLANVLFALGTCWAMLRLLAGRVPFWAAASAVGGMATTAAFLFGAELARNDALPVFLLTLGLWAMLPRGELTARRAGLAGLVLGLAISAKISSALPAAGVGLWLLWQAPRKAVPAVAGGIVGLLPTLILYAAAPAEFTFGVFTYSLEAPQQYWAGATGAHQIAPLQRLKGMGIEALIGASAVALLLWLGDLRRGGAERRLLDLAAAGGLLAAFLPEPFFRQYLIPLLPPLFARAAFVLAELGPRGRRVALVAGAVTAAVGFVPSVRALRWPPHVALSVERARLVAAAARGGEVVTLAPEQVAGVGIDLHPGFTAGPFLFRTSDALAKRVRAMTGAPTWQDLSALDRAPPAVIVTGGERRSRTAEFPQGLDIFLERWAAANNYRPRPLPGKGWILWLAPERQAGQTKKGGPAGPPFRAPER